MLNSILIMILSSLLWRIRGGLWKKYIPANKIWYAVAFAFYSGFYFIFEWETLLIGFLTAYVSYQAFGWGLYIGRLLDGEKVYPNLAQYRENELIDDLLYSLRLRFKDKIVWLYEYPRLWGFCGTTLTGLIITFLWGLYLGSLIIMLSGLGMGVCYWLGGKLEKLWSLGKSGWNWGEIIFGAYLGAVLSGVLVW